MTKDYTPEPIESRIARYKNIADNYPVGHPEAEKIYRQIEEMEKNVKKGNRKLVG
jgi:hypothetical protein